MGLVNKWKIQKGRPVFSVFWLHVKSQRWKIHVSVIYMQSLKALVTKTQGRKLIKILVTVLGISFGVGFVTLSVVIILCFRRKIKMRKDAKYNVKVEMFLKNHEFLVPKRYSYAQVEKITSSFKVKLGKGGFGTVYKGVLRNQNQVAVKVLNEVKSNGEDFINEVASVGRTSHVNIVSLMGFCLEGRQRALIYEFMPNGSLERFINNQGSSSSSQLIGWEKLHQIAIGIARGLEYLYRGCSTRILHFDIKPHNILLDDDFCPKISDFGMAKLFREKESKIFVSHMRGTPGYIAPEIFSRSFGEISHKSDVYSYGMMILEMVGGRKNIEVGVDNTSEIYFPHWIYKKVELHDEQLGLNEIVSEEENKTARKMIIVGLWCIQTNPLTRPSITKVLEMLEGDVASLEIPPKPYISSPSSGVEENEKSSVGM
ncbi:LEAF RUST 10 DISEASE-RESISTANCE LOCUS RECEPTOR-LIKE PROTEIN KINASE-like 2.5 isoform X3 [Helianthus annuus]|uniref:LEAF RUST 10 DISEASE-RESISTANCE LOCUS RECEPTOR-LIKE PROTEIN KINASE-like 2.5 isoform X3 n=1 Tax=Helianthus annuus TaxID=4232 RepID=UPI001652E822|nr:LEAF RUST 10 DISEASE-RESISTANCE LOCUS RECEPTOR-LIKE PROTEIN KINASE-like 2.5 isoform X3 [Helianthus annuus]